MACQAIHEIHSWSFSALVGAFLDLFIAYFLLCASTFAFFASKFLAIFGLYLPCPCNGLFSDPCRRNCIERFLVNTPIEKISSVQLSVKDKFPFDPIFTKDHNQGSQLKVKLVKDRDHSFDGFLEMEGEASCSSYSDPQNDKLLRLGSMNLPAVHKGVDGYKGKKVLNQRLRPGTLRRRRRAFPDGNRMVGRESSLPPLGSGPIQPETTENDESSVRQDDDQANAGVFSDEGPQHSFQWNDLMGESKNFGRDESSASDVVRRVQHELVYDRSEVNAVRILEQALEEEHAARAALYQELEKERSAAASAADEAMAMILRLQKEKASTEMEAKQYQRMIEEKSAYDLEEMNILKEILLRREREKHFLEKELEAYRQIMTPGNEELVGISTQRPHTSFDSSEDPALMLQQISEYIDKKEMAKMMNNSSDYDALSVEKYGRVLTFEEESPSPYWNETDDLANQGDARMSLNYETHHGHGPECRDESLKGLLSVPVEECSSDPQHKLDWTSEQNSLEKNIVVDEEEGIDDTAASAVCQEMAKEKDQNHETEVSISCDRVHLEKHGNKAHQDGIDHLNFEHEAEPTVLDVHVVDHVSKLYNQESEKATVSLPVDTVTGRCRKFKSETSGLRSSDTLSMLPRGETQSNIRRSVSDMRSTVDKAQAKTLLSDMRRNSVSSVDYERMKLESEVGFLTERLKIVQEGREKLSFSVEHREREKMHLQLLEDIARQLRDIRQITEPGRSIRQASLPPSSSKASSKKRRCRSISWGVHASS
ncbi:Myosin-binding protein [Thalictrum thalictroides]|uniref:Myosin-binding protein n=1 Tax=Thalictrum thalictroides TaxID=46969 RepID=A0A7J6WY28_THATH|nr:Myosin-binding protein [Thalictrum thalictroides]